MRRKGRIINTIELSKPTRSEIKSELFDEVARTYIRRMRLHFCLDEGKKEKTRSPDGHALRFKMMPSLIHLVQSTLKHNRVILTG